MANPKDIDQALDLLRPHLDAAAHEYGYDVDQKLIETLTNAYRVVVGEVNELMVDEKVALIRLSDDQRMRIEAIDPKLHDHYSDLWSATEKLRASLPRSFPVTNPVLDAPDGARVDGYERHGGTWEKVDDDEPKPKKLSRKEIRKAQIRAAQTAQYTEPSPGIRQKPVDDEDEA